MAEEDIEKYGERLDKLESVMQWASLFKYSLKKGNLDRAKEHLDQLSVHRAYVSDLYGLCKDLYDIARLRESKQTPKGE